MSAFPDRDVITADALNSIGCDSFERGLLAVARHFLNAFEDPKSQAWQHGYTVAVERWGETIGFPAAHAMSKLIRALLRGRADGISFFDPLCVEARTRVSADEALLMKMLHHMRRDQTSPARDAVEALTLGRMDPDVIRAGLSLASRFSAGCPAASVQRPSLRVVS
ncbi:MAG: hypothetical protein AAGA94_15295 [Pseudomonadota bacterium]